VLQSVKTACVAVSKSMGFGATFLTCLAPQSEVMIIRLTNGNKTLNGHADKHDNRVRQDAVRS